MNCFDLCEACGCHTVSDMKCCVIGFILLVLVPLVRTCQALFWGVRIACKRFFYNHPVKPSIDHQSYPAEPKDQLTHRRLRDT